MNAPPILKPGNNEYFEHDADIGVVGRGATVEVMGGVKAGEPVVTTGAFLLKTELMKESIGAGCCDADRPGK